MMYLDRLSSTGMNTSKYFADQKWNHFVGTANDLPNCVAFCLGETYEAVNPQEPFKMFNDRGAGGAPEAKEWYDKWIGAKGVEPKVGGIVVWGSKTSKWGHVAFVLETEDIGAQGCKIKVCQSNYKGAYFEVKEYIIKKGVVTEGVGYPYIGCCCNEIPDRRTTRNRNVMQVEIFGDYVRARKTPNGEIYSGRYCPKGLYTVLDVASEGQYGWVKLDADTWVATSSDWAKVYPAESEDELKEAKKEINRLTVELENTKGLYENEKKATETAKAETEVYKKEVEKSKSVIASLTGKVKEISAKLKELIASIGV